MTELSDVDLLERYVRDGSEAAFTGLVERHISLVHSVALRCTANAAQAQDITQAVFVILARKAATLNRRTILPGWLYHTARLTAANLQRAEASRIRREQEAYMQSIQEDSPDALWTEIAPQLEEAMARLRADERDALVLRYFQNKSFAEVAVLIGKGEAAARKQVQRAVEKLRGFFLKRGVKTSVEGISRTISTHSIQPAPALLAKTVATLALAKGATASVSTLTLIQGALKIMAWTKAKTAIVAGAVVLLIAGVTPVVWHYHFSPNAWRYRFDAAYRLRHGELLRHIAQPYIPERLTYYQTDDPTQARLIPAGPNLAVFKQNQHGQLHQNSYTFGPKQFPLRDVLRFAFGFKPYEFEGPDNLLNLTVNGDWTISEDLTNRDQLVTALEPLLLQATKRHVTFDKQTVERDVIVVSGSQFNVPPGGSIQLYAEKSSDQGYESYGDLNNLLNSVGERLYIRFVNETEINPDAPEIKQLTWANHSDSYVALKKKNRDQLIDEVLKHLSDQTGLTFTRAKRTVDVWLVSDKN